ncbi:MAG TPA: hypothetical protein VFZ73_04050 [Gemmatimonadaceae bacterium]
MRVTRYVRVVAGIAVVLSAATVATAQDPTRPVSDVRIPIQKDGRRVQESRGDVALAAEIARVNVLEEKIAFLQQRLQAADEEIARLSALPGRVAANEESIRSLEGSFRTMREELVTTRNELAAANARVAALQEQVTQFDRRMNNLKYGSLFGHSGFYVGIGTGVNFTTGTLHDIGYGTGLNVVMPIGWSKPENILGVRGELGVQTFEGRLFPGAVNIDPRMYTATAMLTINLPLNQAKTNLFYLMGGGGLFMFDRVGTSSMLNERTGGTETKFGITGGAGMEFHILGATSLFVQSAFTNLFGDKPATGTEGSRHLRWVPLVAGITLR